MTRFQAPRGAPDVLPPASELLSEVEAAARMWFDRYGYRRIDTPIFEATEVFTRSAGAGSDIMVKKEMYTFEDRKGRSLTLRPEGTAPVVRAFVQHNLQAEPLPVRLGYIGPYFRYERAQRSRQRQFPQIGTEAIGSASPLLDVESIVLGGEFFASVGLQPELLLNSMGCRADQAAHQEAVRTALDPDDMCDDCKERLRTNPLRVFDCKVESCRQKVADLPPMRLCADCSAHDAKVREALDVLEVKYTHTPDLVRGFDYYMRTVWEWVLPSLGARSAVAGGGRYDGLVAELGGPDLPGVGMAIGVVPTMVALSEARELEGWRPDVYLAVLGDEQLPAGLAKAAALRTEGRRVIMSDDASRPLKSQLAYADRIGARTVMILGPKEAERGVVVVKDLSTGEQTEQPC